MKKKKNTGKRKRAGRKTSVQTKMAMLCISTVMCLLLFFLVYESRSMQGKIQVNESKKASLEQQIASEEERTDEIDAMKEYMQSDEYIEKIAREKIGLVKDNEIIFKENK